MNSTVDTSKAPRRKLRFASVDELFAEVDRIAAADQAATLRRTGNWTAGQVMSHLAAWIEYGYHGYPLKPPPFFIRWILKRKIKAYLQQGLPAGVRIPGAPDGTYGAQDVSTQEGADRLRRALSRLAGGEPCAYPSPAFGPMRHEDRIALNLRHAELHLSFLHPE